MNETDQLQKAPCPVASGTIKILTLTGWCIIAAFILCLAFGK